MKPFDLEAAKRGDAVCTRDGRPARIICFDRRGGAQLLIGLITNEDGEEVTCSFNKDGSFLLNPTRSHEEDLLMATKKY